MTDTINLNEKLYTPTEASKEFGIPAPSMRWACQKNVIHALKNKAGCWLIPESEIKKYACYRSFTNRHTKGYELCKMDASAFVASPINTNDLDVFKVERIGMKDDDFIVEVSHGDHAFAVIISKESVNCLIDNAKGERE